MALRLGRSLQSKKLISSVPCFLRSRLSSSSSIEPTPFLLDPPFVEVPVSTIHQAAHHVFSLVIDVSSAPSLRFGHIRAGQFAPLRVSCSRPAFMSIASPPKAAAEGTLEFLIKYIKGQTAGLLCNLREGDIVSVGPISGSGFRLELLQDLDTIFLFATGTGISPIRSLIEGGLNAHKREDVRLYYGCRNLQSMAYEERFTDWESGGIKVFPVFSQLVDDFDSGKSGYVQAFFARENYIFNPLKAGAVVSGHKSMVQEVTRHLVAEGVPLERILTNF